MTQEKKEFFTICESLFGAKPKKKATFIINHSEPEKKKETDNCSVGDVKCS